MRTLAPSFPAKYFLLTVVFSTDDDDSRTVVSQVAKTHLSGSERHLLDSFASNWDRSELIGVDVWHFERPVGAAHHFPARQWFELPSAQRPLAVHTPRRPARFAQC